MATSGNTYPVNVSAQYPETSSRIWALLGFLFFLKTIALIPHYFVLFFLAIASIILMIIGYIVVLFVGKYPRGLFDFQIGVARWNFRLNCWVIGLTDKYPPFSLI